MSKIKEDAMEFQLTNKVVLVTGASRGIGAACARALALSADVRSTAAITWLEVWV
ncbi:hypothetical protein ACHHRT_10440 [Desulfurivibrio sp. D14AmB]|uniref:hypothetical protein n=1 Tax=Desulfurivibrio sp. D14AmB TaxID=3374370 RepID=UPI00376EC057